MATEKNEVKEEVNEAKEEEVNEVKKEKKVKAPEEPAGEKKVTIRLPRTKENSGPLFVSVNERTFLIQRGVPVSVPECVAEVIEASERAADEAVEFEESAKK